ncbi:hypothetical protein CHH83_20925 [Bacillus sp. 7586-K]|nr:hypothetical protein CHH83_20925 [Bacillus sp. 7586-K]
MPTEKISYSDVLQEGTDKLNSAIDQANRAEVDSQTAVNISNNAVNKATEANAKADDTQTQLNKIILENGTSDAEVIQARGNEELLYKRLSRYDSQLNGGISLKALNRGIIQFQYDDGTTDHYSTVFPLHRERNIPMVMALDIQNVLRYGSAGGRINYEQMKTLYESGLVEFASHSMTHIALNSTVSEERVKWELEGSFDLIESLGFEVNSFVAPNSVYDMSGNKENVLKNIYSCGYTVYLDSTTATPQQANDNTDIYKLKRINGKAGLDKLKACIDYAETNKTLCVIYFHKILADGTGDFTPNDLATLLDYVLTKNVDILKSVDAISQISTRLVAKTMPTLLEKQIVNNAATGNRNIFTNTLFKGTNTPSEWFIQSTLTGTVTTSIVPATPANEFVVTTGGNNTGVGEVYSFQQDYPINSLYEPLPLCLSIRAKGELGFVDTKLRMKIVAKDVDGTQLYETTKEYSLDTLYRDYYINHLIPRDSAVKKVTFAIYFVNNKVSNQVKFSATMPKAERGLKPSKWIEGNEDFITKDFAEATKRTTQQVIAASTYEKVLFDTTFSSTTNNCFNTSLSRFTASRAGVYMVTCSQSIVNGIDGARYLLQLRKNGTAYRALDDSMKGTGKQSINFSYTLYLNSGDFLEFFIWHDGTGKNITLSLEPYAFVSFAEL